VVIKAVVTDGPGKQCWGLMAMQLSRFILALLLLVYPENYTAVKNGKLTCFMKLVVSA